MVSSGSRGEWGFARTVLPGPDAYTSSVIAEWAHAYEPEKVESRKSRVTPRKPYICAGVNEIWAFDQHDKLMKWGLWLHVGVDTFSGMVLWVKVWWTNSNPRLVCKYYLDVIEKATTPRMSRILKLEPMRAS